MAEESQKEYKSLELQLGDVIHITNPVNDNLNDQTFIIDYIDKSKMYLINAETFNKIKVKISDEGILGDGNITNIDILSRADSPSYARQNGLLPGKWIKIIFGDPDPAIIVGKITNLEQDMIEITTTDKDVIYLNFEYKGIPEYLPIENIEIIGKPPSQLKVEEEIEVPELEFDKDKKVIPLEDIQIEVPVKDVKEQLREIIVKADQIVFGDEDFGPIKQFVDVSTKLQRHSIEEQVSDLLDDLLSTIPNAQRTTKVLNNIHIMIDRFKQLREEFSGFDQYGMVESMLVHDANWKPLLKWLKNFNNNLYWIMPVVKNIKKIYVDGIIQYILINYNDLNWISLTEEVGGMQRLIDNYKSNNLPSESNKYTALYSDLAQYFRPFNQPKDEELDDIIIEKEVNSNINVIIDNLQDFYSSVFNAGSIRDKRFLISKYTLGDTKLDTTDITSSKMTTVRINITNNDLMSIKSIMTLPEPTIRFSKINLPGTDILTRANLNQIFLNYWQLLKKNTRVADVFIDDFENKLELDETQFVNGIRNYVLNIPSDQLKGMTRNEIYSNYIDTIIPKTRIIFNLMKKYINGKLSIVEVVSYLESFLIYTDDLTFMQYRDIVQFIDEKISEYNKNIISFSRIFKELSTIKQNPVLHTKAFTIVEILDRSSRDEIFETGYGFHNPEQTFTNSEILRKIMLKDYARLYTSAISYENSELMFPKDVSEIFDVEKKHIEGKINDAEKGDECKNITIAKLYTSLEQLENDNDKIIYFDKKYDKTNYGIMEEEERKKGYAEKVLTLTPEDLKFYIIQDQMKRNGLSETDATYIAETLIDGNKRVIDGQYALLYKGFAENIKDENDYYVRKDNKWVLDKELNKNNITDEESVLCDLQNKCISTPTNTGDKCQNMKTNELNLQNTLLKNIISEFDTKYKVSQEEFRAEISKQFNYFLSIMPIVSKIETNELLKYNNQKYKLGINIEDDSKGKEVSPFYPLLQIILGQRDFGKKQKDIITFANKFTRPHVQELSSSGDFESEHWLYCIKTNTPLLPTFKKKLAAAFIESSYTYQIVLENVKTTNGQLSDDGDWWTDKYTGWPICPGDFDIEEGYEEGFKVSTRAVMEEDAGNKIMSSTTEKTVKYITPETIMINNIINAISIAMGINIESQKEFIINCVMDTMKNTIDSESEYKQKIKTSTKQMPSYRDYFNTSLLFYTLGMYLIGVQTIIPSVKTRKTHPGCVRSFTGYPFEGQADLSSLTYLACITYDIRDSGEPWNVLKKTNAGKIADKIKIAIDQALIQLPEVQRKFEEKTQYLLINPISEIPKEHDIGNWSSFLPPLMPFKIKHLQNISSEFEKSLKSDLINGRSSQKEKILVIESKIIQFSLAIQERIQNIVKTHKLLLHTSNNEPYLENACCDSKETETTISYFINRDPDISQFNNIVQRLNNILDDIRSYTQSPILYSNINTKNIYQSTDNIFDEKTIYLAFIFYCKFKSLMPIPQDLLPLCTDKPDSSLINPADPIGRIIQKLKDDGRNYTNQEFLRLIQLISRENIINIQFDNPIISCVSKLSELIDAIYDENDENEMIELALRDAIKNAIDTFDIARTDSTKEVKDLNDFLIRTNKDMTEEIIDFIQKNSGANVSRNSINKFRDSINFLPVWNFDNSNRNENIKISNDSMYNIVSFYRTFIDNFVNVFPNIILNKVNYDNTSIPNYYNFSKFHSNKLIKYISDYFSSLKKFYGIPTLLNVLTTIQKQGKNLVKLSKVTPSFSSIKNGDTILRGVIDERTSRFLFEYYLLRIFIGYINLSNDENMIVTEVKKKIEITDIFSVDYIEDVETRVDLGMSSRNITDTRVMTGNKKILKEKTAELLISFMEILQSEKDMIDITYEDIQDKVFKLREGEKDMVTDRLKGLTDEGRDIDTTFKILKQGIYSKGLEKGLTMYDKDFYERPEEQQLMENMEKIERKLRRKNKDVTDENIDILIDEELERQQMEADIDNDVNDIGYLGETYYDGGYDGVDAPEREYEDFAQED